VDEDADDIGACGDDRISEGIAEESEQGVSDWENDDDSSQFDAIETDASEHHDLDAPSTSRSSIELNCEDVEDSEPPQPVESVNVFAFQEHGVNSMDEVAEGIPTKEAMAVDKTLAEPEAVMQEGLDETAEAVDEASESKGDATQLDSQAESSPSGDGVDTLEDTPVLDPVVGEAKCTESKVLSEASEPGVESATPDDVGSVCETIGK
jgi:hypothetical protein